MVVRVVAKTLYGREGIVDLCDTEEQFQSITVLQLREKIDEKIPDTCCCENPENVRLLFGGKQLEDSSLLTSYGIQHMSTIHLIHRIRGGRPEKGDGGMGDKEGKNRSQLKVKTKDNT